MNTLGVKGSYRLVQEIGKQLGKEGVKLVNEFKNADITKKAEILGRSLTYAVPTKALASGTLKLISKNQVIVKGVKAAKTGAAFIKQKGVVKVTLATPIVGKVGKRASKVGKVSNKGVGNKTSANIGTKLEYVFGKATGSAHNIERSTGMLRQLQKVGIFDNAKGRSLLQNHLKTVYNGTKGVLQSNGRFLRESILMGPNGGLKVESIWEGNKLITVKLLGGK